MGQRRRLLSARWALPGAALITVGAVLAGTDAGERGGSGPAEADASRSCSRPCTTRSCRRPMTATVSESANLGFPALPSIGGMQSSPLSASSLISGTHTFQIWYAGPGKLRIALPVSFGETDLRVNKTQAWLWESQGQKATRIILSPPPGIAVPGAGAHAAPPAKIRLHPKPCSRRASPADPAAGR